MKKNLQRILSLLCILSLVFGITAAAAEAVPTETRIIMIKWEDGNDYNKIRPTGTITATLGGQTAELNADNGWTGQVEVPADTSNDWVIAAPAKYAGSMSKGPITVVTFQCDVTELVDVRGSIEWEDNHNAKGIRPDSVKLMLYADGEPYGEPKSGLASVKWEDVPRYAPNADTPVVYTVKPLQVPEGYTCEATGTSVKFTIATVNVTVAATVSGAPAGTDLNALRLYVDGPDPAMPKTLTYADVAGGSYTFTDVLPGAYLVRDLNADSLAEGCTMDKNNSKVCDAVYVSAGTGTLNWKYTYKELTSHEEEEGYDKEEYENYDPWGNVGSLKFRVLGPDVDMTVSYSQFTGGKYELPNLKPGVYTVVEMNAEKLVKYYTLTSDSKTALKLEVTANGSATAKLFNQYVPAPTPEPDAEFVDIPVTKTWNDSNNKDGNRPGSVTVRLYADGVEINSHVLTAAENWKYTFTELPRYQEDNKTEIVYSVNEDDVSMYLKEIIGYNLVNTYLPEVTSRSVAKAWDDNNNEQKLRPSSIVMILMNNRNEKVASVVLDAGNNWTATVSNLPTVVGGEKAVYSWKEQEVLGYKQLEAKEQNGTMTFVNTLWKRPDNPTKGGKPKTPGNPHETIDDYDTPLGVEVIINHVGDCFD